MTAFNGLSSHILLVHFMVMLVPLTALLEIVCALWPGRSPGTDRMAHARPRRCDDGSDAAPHNCW